MSKLTGDSIFDRLDDLDSSTIEICSRGVRLSKIAAKFNDTAVITSLIGKFQRLGFIKIVINPELDEEPLVQITENGRQQAIELLRALQLTG
jgi:hypothetical protein